MDEETAVLSLAKSGRKWSTGKRKECWLTASRAFCAPILLMA